MNPQLQPLENIILTPARASDGPLMIPIFNDERVYPWLIAPPFPYLPEHADWWLNNLKPLSDAFLVELEAARNEPLKIVDACPVRAIREVKEDGTDIFLGEIGITLAQQPWELEGSGKLSQDTPRRDPNDPDIWTLDNYLAPSHHGQGIMSDAVQTLLLQWGIPRMGVQRMVVSTLEGNKGSVRVFEKNGFKFRKTIDDAIDVRGTKRGVHVLEWSLDEAKVDV
ncbi:acyl-CoA N-acyltransferase [Mycena polygramma]|nr:acyl-CoA N-acyltransferase [Mycena polygramma]